MFARAVFFTLVALVFRADARADEAKLFGSATKVEDAVANADAIFVGKVTSIGNGYAKGLGPTYYSIGISPAETYLGSVVSNPYSYVRITSLGEHLPSVGNAYIFFVKKQVGRELLPLKLIPATDTNIAVVKKLISK